MGTKKNLISSTFRYFICPLTSTFFLWSIAFFKHSNFHICFIHSPTPSPVKVNKREKKVQERKKWTHLLAQFAKMEPNSIATLKKGGMENSTGNRRVRFNTIKFPRCLILNAWRILIIFNENEWMLYEIRERRRATTQLLNIFMDRLPPNVFPPSGFPIFPVLSWILWLSSCVGERKCSKDSGKRSENECHSCRGRDRVLHFVHAIKYTPHLAQAGGKEVENGWKTVPGQVNYNLHCLSVLKPPSPLPLNF